MSGFHSSAIPVRFKALISACVPRLTIVLNLTEPPLPYHLFRPYSARPPPLRIPG